MSALSDELRWYARMAPGRPSSYTPAGFASLRAILAKAAPK